MEQHHWSSEDLWRAASSGDHKRVSKIVQDGEVFLDAPDSNSKTPLFLAARFDHVDVIKVLVHNHATLEWEDDEDGSTPLLEAVKFEQERAALALIQCGANVRAANRAGATALHLAVKNDRPKIVEALLRHNADVLAEDCLLSTPLHWAAEHDRVAVMVLLASRLLHEQVNKRDKFGRMPLHVAALNGQVKALEKLLYFGAPVNAQDSDGCTPLFLAASHDAPKRLMEILLQRGADANIANNAGQLPLVDSLLNHQRQKRARQDDSHSTSTSAMSPRSQPFSPAASTSTLNLNDLDDDTDQDDEPEPAESAQHRVLRGHSPPAQQHARPMPTSPGSSSKTAMSDVSRGSSADMQIVVSDDDDEPSPANHQRKPMGPPFKAVKHQPRTSPRTAVIEQKAVIKLEKQQRYDTVPATTTTTTTTTTTKYAPPPPASAPALSSDYSRFSPELMLSRASPMETYSPMADIPRCPGSTSARNKRLQQLRSETSKPLDRALTAARTGNTTSLAQLLRQWGQILLHYKDDKSNQYSLLHHAVEKGHLPVLRMLLDAGADANVSDREGVTALDLCAQWSIEAKFSRIACAELLMKRGARITTNIHGNTPLHTAAMNGGADFLRFLLDQEDTVDRCDNKALWTPLHFAAEHGREECVKLLIERGADVNAADYHGATSLHWAATNGHHVILNLLAGGGANLNAQNRLGDTALHIAAFAKSNKCVKILLTCGANPNVSNNRNLTPSSKTSEACMRLMERAAKQRVWERIAKPMLAVARRKRTSPLITPDISEEAEECPVSVYNDVDDEDLPAFHYVTKNVEGDAIHIDRNANSLRGCSCTGPCVDPRICECARQMGGLLPYENGATKPNFSGVIYECNYKCSCSKKSCPNRVVQLGLRTSLQIYKTRTKGWGVRTLKPIKRGELACEYCGEIITDQEAEERGKRYDRQGCSYLYDLDIVGGPGQDGGDLSSSIQKCIDATQYGNMARFINHSCDPNIVKRVVFVDHHDSLFPRIAFYAARDIAANEELTYDYNYKLNMSTGLTIICQCGAANCRGRLL
eukprot:TRINITY_DN11004_c0_g1_i1.p1 TRINITY_DN11004_c0_g1~~TRINITY_DN11004_c0_g1_i1.p1  ORF type:complete len:1063 (-),score=199.34 TRINITY_DN11004_c0_g1_i1:3-3140(-)